MAEDNEESLLLAFKESGVEFVEDAAKAVGELGEQFKDLDKTTQTAVDVLKSESTVIEDLKEKIAKLKTELETLNDATKAGLVPLDKYVEQSGKLIQVIGDSESTLKRLTAAEREREKIADEVEKTLEKEALAQQKVAEAAAEASAKIEEQGRAEQAMADIADEAEKPLARMTGTGDGEQGEGGLKGLAGGAIKAEKAMMGLASGHIGRIGSQLEGVLPLLGGPAGMGLAIGALIIGVHDLIPKLKEWFDTFQEGSKEVRDAEKAIKDFDVAQKSVHEDMRKRSLVDVDKEIEAMEAVERAYKEYGGRLNEEEQRQLTRLCARSKTGHEQEGVSKELGKIGPTKAQREMGQAVREAITEAGGLGAVIGDDAGEVARRMVASAMAGDQQSIETLKQWSPEFATMWNVLDPAKIRQAKRQEAGAKTIADVETKTAKNVEQRQKRETADNRFDRRMVESEEDRVVRENAKAAQDEADAQIHEARREAVAQRKADAGAKHHAAEAARQARENTPEAINRREIKEEQNQVMGIAQQFNQNRAQFGGMEHPAFDPSELQKVVSEVSRNRTMNSRLGFDIAQQVDYYMGQLEAKVGADFSRGMGQQNRTGQNSTGYP